jgi:hypothetical protein
VCGSRLHDRGGDVSIELDLSALELDGKASARVSSTLAMLPCVNGDVLGSSASPHFDVDPLLYGSLHF